MTIASAVLLWVALVLSSMDVFIGRRRARKSPQMTEKCVQHCYFTPRLPL